MSFFLYFTGLILIGMVALVVSLPLFLRREPEELPSELDGALERWLVQREEALAAIREAEFDLQMGKLSAEDYRFLRAKYETRALEAMAQMDRLGGKRSAPEV